MKKIIAGILALAITACSTPIINTTHDFSDLEKEYKSFSTKALSDAYIKRMFDKFITLSPTPIQVIRQLEFARYLKNNSDTTYFDSLKSIIANEPQMYLDITAMSQISDKMTSEHATFGTFVESLSPFPGIPMANPATNVLTTTFTANWTSVSNATGYKLYLNGAELYSGPDTNFNFTGLTEGTTYTYYVKAYNNAGISQNSNSIQASLSLSTPDVPVAKNATNITTTTFTANWDAVAAATSYKLYIDGSLAYSGNSISYNATGFSSGSNHSYYVQSVGAGGTSASSNSINVILNPALPSTPVASAATNVAQTTFTANWGTASGATSYKLYIDSILVYSGTSTTYNATGFTAGTSHTYYVQSVGPGGTSVNSNTINVTTLLNIPSAPVASAATSVTQTTFIANWAAASGATSYKIVIDGTETVLGNVTSYSKTGLTAGSVHNYYVKAVNSGGTSANSNTINVTTLLNIPSAPVASAATSITQTTFIANWAAASGATSYKIVIDGTETVLGNVTSYSKTGLTAGSVHNYYVKAVNSGGTSANSNTINVTTLLNIPSAPVATAATSITATSFTANWGAVSGATSYKIVIDGAETVLGNVTSYSKTGLTAGTAHNYYVNAVNSGGTSANSNTINVTTLLNIPSAPVATTATSITATSFTANWGAVSGATSYKIVIDGAETVLGNVTSYSKTGLITGSPHNYYVKAVNSGGTSANSNTISLTLILSPPTASSATAITSTSFTSNWSAVTYATLGYELYVNGTTYTIPSSATTSYAVKNLTEQTTYTYTLKSKNASGLSSVSNTISVTTTDYTVSAFAGNLTSGTTNATGTNAQFNQPYGIVADNSGNVYVADRNNARIRKITPAGVVTTFAGGVAGYADGTGTNAKFGLPEGLAIDNSGNLYVTDSYTSIDRIRKITPAGVVTSVATSASFNNPTGLALDSSGNLYVANNSGGLINKITPGGVVSNFANVSYAFGIAIDTSGNLFVTQRNLHRIWKVTSAGVASIFAGAGSGFAEGTGTNSNFYFPSGISIDSTGKLYVADWGNHTIRKITPAGVVTNVAGKNSFGYADGVGTNATFNYPYGVTIDTSGNIYVGDTSNNMIRKIK